MKYLFIIFLSLSSTILFAQAHITSQIIDAKTGTPLAYTNIGIVGKNIGTVSDLKGKFEIDLPNEFYQNNLKISMVGYETYEQRVIDFINFLKTNKTIALNPVVHELKQATIISTEFKKEKVVGNKTTSKRMTGGFASNDLGSELGIVMKLKKRPTYIKEFQASIARSIFDTLKFRLNFYDLKKGLPHNKIVDQDIIIVTDIKEGMLVVDLSKYNIIVEDDIFVSLEWIEDLGKDGLYFSVGLFNSPIIVRHTSQGYWKKIRPMGVGFTLKTKY